MHDVLCLYYARTGNTKKAVEEIAAALDAEVAVLDDGVDRSGTRGWLRSGMDSMRKTTQPLLPVKTQRPLSDYRLVILGTPVWAGRCSSVMRTFLKEHGGELGRTAYVLTRSAEHKHEEAYDQMDRYIPAGHCAEVSLRPDSVGYSFWLEEFLRKVRELLAQ